MTDALPSKDVVQRLRDWDTGDDHTGQRLLMEAADELERLQRERAEDGNALGAAQLELCRLRAALEEIAARAGDGSPRRIARAALRGADETPAFIAKINGPAYCSRCGCTCTEVFQGHHDEDCPSLETSE